MPEINFFWDPLSDNILQERDETGAVTAEYTAEPGLYGNLISQNRGGVESQFHYDAQGSTLAVTNDDQNVTDTFAYTAFGEVTERTGTTEVPFQYIGQKGYYTDGLTGQIMARRRPYEPVRARWLSADPLGLSRLQCNTYRYVQNRSLVGIDPSGLIVVTPICADDKHPIDIRECGKEAVARWNFRLEKKEHCPGFMVQHVQVRCKVSSCEDCPIGAAVEIPIVAEFLEAWFVEENKEVDERHAQYGYSDKSNYTARMGFCGVNQQTGVGIKFFCLSDIGDLRKSWKANRRYGTLPFCEFSTGDLISIGTGSIGGRDDELPDWWSKPGEEKAGKRDFSLSWTCCGCGKKVVAAATANPDPTSSKCEKFAAKE